MATVGVSVLSAGRGRAAELLLVPISGPRTEQALKTFVEFVRVATGCGEDAVQHVPFAGLGQSGLASVPFGDEVPQQGAPVEAELFGAGEAFGEHATQGIPVGCGNRRLEVAGKTQGFVVVPWQGGGDLLERTFRKDVFGGRSGDLMVEGTVVVRRRCDAPQGELAQGFTCDVRGLAGVGHFGSARGWGR
jgi:hypothetical protein